MKEILFILGFLIVTSVVLYYTAWKVIVQIYRCIKHLRSSGKKRFVKNDGTILETKYVKLALTRLLLGSLGTLVFSISAAYVSNSFTFSETLIGFLSQLFSNVTHLSLVLLSIFYTFTGMLVIMVNNTTWKEPT